LAKLRILSGREICLILARHGFAEVRRQGSHIVMQKKVLQSTITVPVPDHDEIRIGTLQSIIRQSGLPRTEYDRIFNDRHPIRGCLESLKSLEVVQIIEGDE
jgi:predicted RNA binding protein YcfA (HicA-like mRNA interferase family)